MSEAEVQDLVNEITEEVVRTVAATELAIVGIRRLVREVEAVSPPPENPDPMMFVGDGDPNVRMEPHGWIRRSELIAQSVKGGVMEALFTQQWIAATFAKWEHAWRPRLAGLLDVEPGAVVSDLFGDLRLLRNEILHHGGIACGEHASRCVLIPFERGDVVSLGAEHFRKIISHVDVRVDSPAGGH